MSRIFKDCFWFIQSILRWKLEIKIGINVYSDFSDALYNYSRYKSVLSYPQSFLIASIIGNYSFQLLVVSLTEVSSSVISQPAVSIKDIQLSRAAKLFVLFWLRDELLNYRTLSNNIFLFGRSSETVTERVNH